MSFEYKQYYRRKRPHLHSPDATLFVTFRLAGSIPQVVIGRWRAKRYWMEMEGKRIAKLVKDESDTLARKHQERWVEFHREWFAKFEEILHRAETGPVWLKDPALAQMVYDSLRYRDGRVYRLFAFCIMSNHVHVVFKPNLTIASLTEVIGSSPLRYESTEPPLGSIMQSLKGYTAKKANHTLGRTGQFWEVESYDHEVRDGAEFSRIVKYVLNNPVKAGLVSDWRDWNWSWVRDDCAP